ncbi:MAG: molybdopterin-dependent oxidoreductase [Vicinamibacterales bacterium]
MSNSLTHTVGRRTFLKVLGSAGPAAAVAACSPVPPERIIPYVVPPEDVVPGVATWYATVCGECPAGCGMIVRTREGRAVKVEGNPDHPVNRGSLCIRGQASLQGLYNPDRFTGPRRRRTTNAAAGHSVLEDANWDDAQGVFVEQLQAVRDTGRAGRVAIVTPLMTGTVDRLVDQWATAVGARRLRYEAFAYEAVRAANRVTFSRDAIPQYDFASPDLVVSFGADFLETWLSTVGYSRDHAEGRRVRDGRKPRFVQIEPRMSLTGASADEWLTIEPGTEALVAAAMVFTIVSEQRVQVADLADEDANRILALVGDHTPEQVAERTGLAAEAIRALARSFADPVHGPGRSLAVGGGIAASGGHATTAQVAINLLNYVAGNMGTTVIFGSDGDVGWDGASDYRAMLELADAMRAGEIDVAILHDVNPVYTMPGGANFSEALANVPFVVSTSSCPDETASRADLVLPTHTPLESWGDVEPRAGVRGLMQPSMQPRLDTKHFGDLLLETGRALGDDVASGLPRDEDFLALLRREWAALQPVQTGDTEAVFWAESQRRGGTWQSVDPIAVDLNPGLFGTSIEVSPGDDTRALTLVVYPSLHYYDGRGANRSWLQEIPDPLMKTAWGSWVELAPETARAIGADEGQLVTLESDHGTVDVSVLMNPHLRAGVAAMPLGQGHTEYGRYATGRGVNPMVLLDAAPEPASGGPQWLGTRVDATPRALHRPMPRLQSTFDQMDRGIAQAVSMAVLASGEVEPEPEHVSLYPPHEHPEHRWGMAIDLDACNGCNACVAACYAENNVPVMGADQIGRGRTMAWLRIERFVEPPGPDAEGTDNRFVPMLCQHCDHAPCETVCPTYATYHTDEGLNAQVYNRCVGTRYCANNCPYKVRRFNWFDPEFDAPLNLQLNPDVPVRSAGVMEKCTFCVQRIRGAQDQAKDDNRSVGDGEITPACAQTCPAQAIVFGDLNDPSSRVSQVSEDARAYHVFSALNTRPAVAYLKKVTRT